MNGTSEASFESLVITISNRNQSGPGSYSDANPVEQPTTDQLPPGHQGSETNEVGAGGASTINTDNTQGPLTGSDNTSAQHPVAGNKAVSNSSGAHVTPGQTDEGHVNSDQPQPAGYNEPTNTQTDIDTGADNKTGPHPPHPTEPTTGSTGSTDHGRSEQQPAGYSECTAAGPTDTRAGAETTSHANAGTNLTSGSDNSRKAQGPPVGDSTANTRTSPVASGNRAGANSEPMTYRTGAEHPGRHDGPPVGNAASHWGPTSTGSDPHDHTTQDVAQATHTTSSSTTGAGPHSKPSKASVGGTKAAFGRVEATVGAMINNSEMHAKGVQKQSDARVATAGKQGAEQGDINVRH
ncbi:hypothetical protein RSOLAG22IIIB_06984 [Rhizoctonia solani]|uniref:Uncharacterized protein n=1 Tax=Rhizoctonia solani TaxID=456999 RepID=A0A0K6GI68_9AGAM|nr:hypothetical protein RSOLAG22IIIB_06984 [Rhizoctonia solani]